MSRGALAGALAACIHIPSVAHADDIVVQGAPRKEGDAQTLSNAEAQLVPGTQGDAGKSILSLPGVARTSFDSGELLVWGSAASETRVYVDGVEIPRLFHGSALRSVLPTEMLQSVSLLPGGFGAEYGRGLGGVVRLKTTQLLGSAPAGIHGSIGVDTLDGHAFASVVPGESSAFAVAGRYGWIDRLLPIVTTRDLGDYVVIPQYGDWQAKGTFALRAREELSVVFVGARDVLRRALPSPDPSAVRAESTTRDFQRAYLRYTRTLDDGAQIEAVPFVGYDRDLQSATFGDVPTRVETGALVYGLRSTHRAELLPGLALTLGFDALGTRARLARRGSLTIPGREGDLTYFGRPPGEEVAVDGFTTHVLSLAPWVETRVEVGPLTVTPGARLDTLLIETSRVTPRVGQTPEIGDARLTTALDPRLAVRLRATPALAFGATWGRHHQAPAPQDLSAVFGTPTLTWSSATHVTGSVTIGGEGLTLDVIGFYKKLAGLPVRTRAATPRLAYELVQDGEGRSYGVELLAKRKLARGLFGFVSYTMSRSERRYVGDAAYRSFDGDQPHVLAIVASQAVSSWTFGARFRVASGLPRTPVIGAYQDLRADRWEPVFGAQNGDRLPLFYALDVRIDHAFSLAETARVIVSLDVQNATFHRNAEELAYSADFRARATITGLPTLAILGARLDF